MLPDEQRVELRELAELALGTMSEQAKVVPCRLFTDGKHLYGVSNECCCGYKKPATQPEGEKMPQDANETRVELVTTTGVAVSVDRYNELIEKEKRLEILGVTDGILLNFVNMKAEPDISIMVNPEVRLGELAGAILHILSTYNAIPKFRNDGLVCVKDGRGCLYENHILVKDSGFKHGERLWIER